MHYSRGGALCIKCFSFEFSENRIILIIIFIFVIDKVCNDFILMSCYILKDVTSEIKTSVTGKAASKDYDADSMIISSPVRPVIVSSGERTELEKSSSAILMPDTAEDLRNPIKSDAVNDEELIKLEQAARKVQAVFRGYLVILLSFINFICQ